MPLGTVGGLRTFSFSLEGKRWLDFTGGRSGATICLRSSPSSLAKNSTGVIDDEVDHDSPDSEKARPDILVDRLPLPNMPSGVYRRQSCTLDFHSRF